MRGRGMKGCRAEGAERFGSFRRRLERFSISSPMIMRLLASTGPALTDAGGTKAPNGAGRTYSGDVKPSQK